jgi:hypothetical protein
MPFLLPTGGSGFTTQTIAARLLSATALASLNFRLA